MPPPTPLHTHTHEHTRLERQAVAQLLPRERGQHERGAVHLRAVVPAHVEAARVMPARRQQHGRWLGHTRLNTSAAAAAADANKLIRPSPMQRSAACVIPQQDRMQHLPCHGLRRVLPVHQPHVQRTAGPPWTAVWRPSPRQAPSTSNTSRSMQRTAREDSLGARRPAARGAACAGRAARRPRRPWRRS